MSNTDTRESLDPLEPRRAKQLYADDRRNEVSDATLQSHGYRIKRFCEFCDEHDIENLNALDGRDIHRYKVSRSNEVNTVTLKSHLDTLRVFLRFCASIDAVRSDLPESVISPSVDLEENRSGKIVPPDTTQDILDYYSKYEYATLYHVFLRIIWETGCRMGAARGIDVDDVDLDDEYIEFHHRPETDTPLKNGKRGERVVSISPVLVDIIDDYQDVHRHEVKDDHGRDPLLTTEYGRLTDATARNYMYRMTRPCMYGRECPHGEEPKSCEATDNMQPYHCPSSEGPHAVRRSAITHFLDQDTPQPVVSDRMDVSRDVLEDHYDERSEKRKMEQRRDYLPNL